MSAPAAPMGTRGRPPKASQNRWPDTLAGTGHLVRLGLRRDRLPIMLWITVTVAIVLGGVAAAETTYPTAQDRQARWEQLQSVPMLVVFQGRAFADTADALAVQQAFAVGTMAAALGAVIVVARGTRNEESSGRRELLGGLPMGRHADLAASLGIALAAGAMIAAMVAGGLVTSGKPIAGSLALALVIGAAALTGTGLAAIAAQLATRAGSAMWLAFGVFYTLHLFRGLGAASDGSAPWLTWAVPNGWWENVRPFAGERWWLLLPALAWILLSVMVAFFLAERRDLGAGILPVRKGPAHGARWLRTTSSLAWRLVRASVIGWAVAIAALGSALGYVGAGAMAEYADLPWVRQWAAELGVAPESSFFTYVVLVLVFPLAAQALHTTLRIRQEESGGTAELMLSGPTGRMAWAISFAGAALMSPVVLLTVLGASVGFGSWIGGGRLVADVAQFTALTVSLAPAIWTVVGVTVLAHGLIPRLSAAVAWTALGVGILTEIAVKIGVLPQVLFLLLSPFAHVNPYYRSTMAVYPVLTLVSLVLVAGGVWAMRRRDLPT